MELINIFSTPILKTHFDIKNNWRSYFDNLWYERNQMDNAYVSDNFNVLDDKGVRVMKRNIEEIVNMYMENYLRLSNRLRITA